MDSKVSAATWAMDRGVSVVICNGMQEKAIKTIVGGRKVGTFFTESMGSSSHSVESMAENGEYGWVSGINPHDLAQQVPCLSSTCWLIGGRTLKL